LFLKTVPQRLKPYSAEDVYGTAEAEAVPFVQVFLQVLKPCG
jgi:hypothetical protein